MSEKSYSNRYKNTRGSKSDRDDSTSFDRARDFNKNSLDRHFNEHGKEVDAKDKYDYAEKAKKFVNRINEDCKITRIKNDMTEKYNVKTGKYAIIDKRGYIVTFFVKKDRNNKKGKK